MSEHTPGQDLSDGLNTILDNMDHWSRADLRVHVHQLQLMTTLIAAASELLQIMHILLEYAESRTDDGDKRPLAHMADARALLARIEKEGAMSAKARGTKHV